MLTDSQRAILAARLRRGRENLANEIPRRPAGQTDLPLSYGQEQLWFLDRFAPGLPTYNMPFALRLTGQLDPAALGRAIDALIVRHEALRTRMAAGPDGRPVQLIGPPWSLRLAETDLSGLAPEARQARLGEFIDAKALLPFSLSEGPLLRCWLLRLAADEHVLLVVAHHTVFDGWSVRVFVTELAALYRQEANGEPSGLDELPVQFADYALWERDRLAGPALGQLEDFWRDTMAGYPTVQFPTDRPRPAQDTFDGELTQHMVDRQTLDQLRELSRQEGATLFFTLLASLYALLYRYTGQADLVVGTASANRSRSEVAPVIGYLVNMLPVRADLSGDPSFTELLGRVREATTAAYAHQDLPLGKMVETLQVERDASRGPLFQIVLTYAERTEEPVPAAGVGFVLSNLVMGLRAAKFDLAFLVEARPEGLWFECSYKTGLFDEQTITRLLGNWDVLLRGVAADPATPLSRLPVLTDRELRQELTGWNDTAASFPDVCVHEAFAEQVRRTPDAPAAQFEHGGPGQQLTYAELNRRANQVARRLRAAGVGPESLVGVCMQSGLPRLAALLGIWKAGGGYVPLDPALPAERLSFMIADTGMRVIITEDASAASLPSTSADVTILAMDAEREQIGALPDTDLTGTGVTPASVAYVIYTSGSTGEPKGVVVEHRQAVNLLLGLVENWKVGVADVVLQFGSFTFDASVMDTFTGLLGGAKVVLAARQTLHSPQRLAALMRDTQVTFLLLPPAVLSLLSQEEFGDIRVLMTGGEELPSEVARSWVRPGLRFVNCYGPTEAAVIATYHELDGSTYPPPIGQPNWPNYQAYVLDPDLNPVPVGVLGELHVGGAGVARGYLNRPELTAERFIDDPFIGGQRLYKTGDLVRRRPDGTLMFAGRVDGQVKIRGLRIELGEIEAALSSHPGVAQAVVTVLTDPSGDKQLAAYLRPAPGTELDLDGVRGHLAGRLPEYMVPAYLTPVTDFPLNSSGKIDKTALPAPQARQSAGYVPPATLIEAMIADMFASLLSLEQVSANDSFFDIGGSSLKAMRLTSMMSDELEVDIGVAEVFQAPTPRQLAGLLRDGHGMDDAGLDEESIEELDEAAPEQASAVSTASGGG